MKPKKSKAAPNKTQAKFPSINRGESSSRTSEINQRSTIFGSIIEDKLDEDAFSATKNCQDQSDFERTKESGSTFRKSTFSSTSQNLPTLTPKDSLILNQLRLSENASERSIQRQTPIITLQSGSQVLVSATAKLEVTQSGSASRSILRSANIHRDYCTEMESLEETTAITAKEDTLSKYKKSFVKEDKRSKTPVSEIKPKPIASGELKNQAKLRSADHGRSSSKTAGPTTSGSQSRASIISKPELSPSLDLISMTSERAIVIDDRLSGSSSSTLSESFENMALKSRDSLTYHQSRISNKTSTLPSASIAARSILRTQTTSVHRFQSKDYSSSEQESDENKNKSWVSKSGKRSKINVNALAQKSSQEKKDTKKRDSIVNSSSDVAVETKSKTSVHEKRDSLEFHRASIRRSTASIASTKTTLAPPTQLSLKDSVSRQRRENASVTNPRSLTLKHSGARHAHHEPGDSIIKTPPLIVNGKSVTKAPQENEEKTWKPEEQSKERQANEKKTTVEQHTSEELSAKPKPSNDRRVKNKNIKSKEDVGSSKEKLPQLENKSLNAFDSSLSLTEKVGQVVEEKRPKEDIDGVGESKLLEAGYRGVAVGVGISGFGGGDLRVVAGEGGGDGVGTGDEVKDSRGWRFGSKGGRDSGVRGSLLDHATKLRLVKIGRLDYLRNRSQGGEEAVKTKFDWMRLGAKADVENDGNDEDEGKKKRKDIQWRRSLPLANKDEKIAAQPDEGYQQDVGATERIGKKTPSSPLGDGDRDSVDFESDTSSRVSPIFSRGGTSKSRCKSRPFPKSGSRNLSRGNRLCNRSKNDSHEDRNEDAPKLESIKLGARKHRKEDHHAEVHHHWHDGKEHTLAEGHHHHHHERHHRDSELMFDSPPSGKRRSKQLDARDSIALLHDHESVGKGPHHNDPDEVSVLHFTQIAGHHKHHEKGEDILHTDTTSKSSKRLKRADSIVLTHAHEMMGKGPHHNAPDEAHEIHLPPSHAHTHGHHKAGEAIVHKGLSRKDSIQLTHVHEREGKGPHHNEPGERMSLKFAQCHVHKHHEQGESILHGHGLGRSDSVMLTKSKESTGRSLQRLPPDAPSEIKLSQSSRGKEPNSTILHQPRGMTRGSLDDIFTGIGDESFKPGSRRHNAGDDLFVPSSTPKRPERGERQDDIGSSELFTVPGGVGGIGGVGGDLGEDADGGSADSGSLVISEGSFEGAEFCFPEEWEVEEGICHIGGLRDIPGSWCDLLKILHWDEDDHSDDEAKEVDEELDQEVELTAWRSHPRDAVGVANLLDAEVERIFGPVARAEMMEKAVFQATVGLKIHDVDTVVGYIALTDELNFVSPEEEIDEWLGERFMKTELITPMNTLFIKCLLHGNSTGFKMITDALLTATFRGVGILEHVLLVTKAPPEVVMPSIGSHFKPLERKLNAEGKAEYYAYACSRQEVVLVLRGRHAIYDDVSHALGLFDDKDKLRVTYGEHFLAELILNQNEDEKVVMVEAGRKTVGMMKLIRAHPEDLLSAANWFHVDHLAGFFKPRRRDMVFADLPLETIDDEFESLFTLKDRTFTTGLESTGCISLTSYLTLGGGTPCRSSLEDVARVSVQESPTLKVLTTQMGLDLMSDTSVGSGEEKAASEIDNLRCDHNDNNSNERDAHKNSKSNNKNNSNELYQYYYMQENNGIHRSHSSESQNQFCEICFNNDSRRRLSSSTKTKTPTRRTTTTLTVDSALTSANINRVPSVVVVDQPVEEEEAEEAEEEEPLISNAAIVRLVAIYDDYAFHGEEFLATVFDAYPDLHWCILTNPTMNEEFPMISNFLRATPKPHTVLNQDLYVFHRDGLIRNLRVRPFVEDDLEELPRFISSLPKARVVFKCYSQFLSTGCWVRSKAQLHAFVAHVEGNIAGFALLAEEVNAEWLKAQYDVEAHADVNFYPASEQLQLIHHVMVPQFKHLAAFFMKEVMRLTGAGLLNYRIYPPYHEARFQTLSTLLDAFRPAKPRRQIVYPETMPKENLPRETLMRCHAPFALAVLPRRLVFEPRLTQTAKIVVVGASTVAVSFLESFIFQPHLRFNNMKLVSRNGFPGAGVMPHPWQDNIVNTDRSYTHDDLARISMRSWVSEVKGKVTGIDRVKKMLIVDGAFEVPFDFLVLATGEQYQTPLPDWTEVGVTNRNFGVQPTNLALIDDRYDARKWLRYAQEEMAKTPTGKVIVYGNDLKTYCCLQSLLRMNVTPKNLVFAKMVGATCFDQFEGSEDISDTIKSAMERRGVRILNGVILSNWQVNESMGNVTTAKFRFHGDSGDGWEAMVGDILVMFSFAVKGKDFDICGAINSDNRLRLDGALVIDDAFNANDDCIWGAGPLTKYNRRFYSEEYTHRNCNSRQVGRRLAKEVLKSFDASLRQREKDIKGSYARDDQDEEQRIMPVGFLKPGVEEPRMVPLLRDPKTHYGILPGDFHFLHVAEEMEEHFQLQEKRELRQIGKLRHKVLTTGSAKTGNLFRLRFDEFDKIASITCFSQSPIEVDNLAQLHGLHQAIMNDIFRRFDAGLVDDLFEYFRRPEMLPLYHDRFCSLRADMRRLFRDFRCHEGDTLIQNAVSLSDAIRRATTEAHILGGKKLNPSDLLKIQQQFVEGKIKSILEDRIVDFLHFNANLLPMFAMPGMPSSHTTL